MHPDDVIYTVKKILSIFPAGDGKIDNFFLLCNVLSGADTGQRYRWSQTGGDPRHQDYQT